MFAFGCLGVFLISFMTELLVLLRGNDARFYWRATRHCHTFDGVNGFAKDLQKKKWCFGNWNSRNVRRASRVSGFPIAESRSDNPETSSQIIILRPIVA